MEDFYSRFDTKIEFDEEEFRESIKMPEILTVEQMNAYGIPDNLSFERQKIIEEALSLKGCIPYEYGGKPTNAGWNARWNNGGGLDCSGFIQWVFWSALGIQTGLDSTGAAAANCSAVSYENLIPGDLGLIYKGDYSDGPNNHIGIYLGNNTWIHCSGSRGVVVDENYSLFHYYVRPAYQETTPEEYENDLVEKAKQRVEELNKKELERRVEVNKRETKMLYQELMSYLEDYDIGKANLLMKSN